MAKGNVRDVEVEYEGHIWIGVVDSQGNAEITYAIGDDGEEFYNLDKLSPPFDQRDFDKVKELMEKAPSVTAGIENDYNITLKKLADDEGEFNKQGADGIYVSAHDSRGEKIGYGHFQTTEDCGPKEIECDNLWVDEEYRRSGIASAMVDKVEKSTGKKSIASLGDEWPEGKHFWSKRHTRIVAEFAPSGYCEECKCGGWDGSTCECPGGPQIDMERKLRRLKARREGRSYEERDLADWEKAEAAKKFQLPKKLKDMLKHESMIKIEQEKLNTIMERVAQLVIEEGPKAAQRMINNAAKGPKTDTPYNKAFLDTVVDCIKKTYLSKS